MIEHPGNELQVIIREKGLTQKAFASILGKKVSEVNELLKGKRNITIQRDFLLHKTLGSPIKYRILKQIDYDYSLLNIEELENRPNLKETYVEDLKKEKELAHNVDGNNFKEGKDTESNNHPLDTKNIKNKQDTNGENGQQKNDKQDIKERAEIFRSF